MKLVKRKSIELEKGYCVAKLRYHGEEKLIAAAEKVNKCLLFDLYGNLEETIWEEPGGTMSIAHIPGSDGCFLAVQRFYSPNDAAGAGIVYVEPEAENHWSVKQVAELPFVHRFGILEKNHHYYIVACTLKSGHKYKDDWTVPGKIWTAQLPENFDKVEAGSSPIPFTVLKEGLTKNHGYYQGRDGSGDFALVGSENGIFKVEPPEKPGEPWKCSQMIEDAASDMALSDLDGDGEQELVTISPFHGDTLNIYHKSAKGYVLTGICPGKLEFAHGIWSGMIDGKPVVLVGHRGGEQSIVMITCENGSYSYETLLTYAGSANLLVYERRGKNCLISANRENNEIAFYDMEI